MTLKGWEEKYEEILTEFNYSKKKDIQSAKILNFILKDKLPLKKLEQRIKNKTIFVIGAGPSPITNMVLFLILCSSFFKGSLSFNMKLRIFADWMSFFLL